MANLFVRKNVVFWGSLLIFVSVFAVECYAGSTFVLPYLPPGDLSSGYWTGITLHNNSNVSGKAELTIYEQDGDKARYSITVPSKGLFVQLLSNIIDSFSIISASGSGIIGDSDSFMTVSCEFEGNGFGMIGNNIESFGVTAVNSDQKNFFFPYFAPADNVWNPLVTIYNNSDNIGTANLDIYELNGDSASATITIPAKGLYKGSLSDIIALATPSAGSGELGDLNTYIEVNTDFYGGGFAMMADGTQGIGIAATSAPSIKGDFDGNGKVGLEDCIGILRTLSGIGN